MAQTVRTPSNETPIAAAVTEVRRTRALLACGVVAGPLFIVVGVLQMLTRDGFDPSTHPLSLLSLGDLGWIQIANFVVTGLLFVASAVGMRRTMYPGRGGTWGPRLIGVYGAALVMGGVFVADAALGFPPGTPEGTPDQLSWHGILHSVAPVLASLSLVVACFVFARRFAALGQRGWAAYCVATGVAGLVPDAFLDHDRFYVVLGVAVALGLLWASVMAARLLAELPEATD
ncbi:MAG: DUF998 domain-containing protein [Jiangellaceae bacterium]